MPEERLRHCGLFVQRRARAMQIHRWCPDNENLVNRRRWVGAPSHESIARAERILMLIHELAKIKSGDVVLPAKTKEGVAKTIRLRCATEPDSAQAVLLHRLGLKLPRRLRRQRRGRSNVVKTSAQKRT
jgi:hypothetical protein